MDQQFQGLFDNGAIFSPCGKYRYALWRIWDDSKPLVMFIGLNPSRADKATDDPTIRRVRGISEKLGYGGFYMTNLFGWVTPYPSELSAVKDPIGENDEWLLNCNQRTEMVIAAWGDFPEAKERALAVRAMIPIAHALIINKNGSPRHPLYVPRNVVPVPFHPQNGHL